MGNELNLFQPFSEVENYIRELIYMGLLKNDINSERLYFCDFCCARYGDTTFYMFNKNTLDELCLILNENNKKVGFNINGTHAELIDTILLYKDLDIEDFDKNINWEDEIKWGYLE